VIPNYDAIQFPENVAMGQDQDLILEWEARRTADSRVCFQASLFLDIPSRGHTCLESKIVHLHPLHIQIQEVLEGIEEISFADFC